MSLAAPLVLYKDCTRSGNARFGFPVASKCDEGDEGPAEERWSRRAVHLDSGTLENIDHVIGRGRSAERSAKIGKWKKDEKGDRARTHLAGCGVHATPRKFEEISSKLRRKTKLHNERNALILALRAAELRHT